MCGCHKKNILKNIFFFADFCIAPHSPWISILSRDWKSQDNNSRHSMKREELKIRFLQAKQDLTGSNLQGRLSPGSVGQTMELVII
jgi:hypothetical protein